MGEQGGVKWSKIDIVDIIVNFFLFVVLDAGGPFMFVFFGDLLDCLIFDLISEAILLELTFLLKTLYLEVYLQ